MADCAMVFPWSLAEYGTMSLDELSRWRERARERLEAQNTGGR